MLHTNTVFTNVSKGQVAKHEDLAKSFNKASLTEICKEILEKGEIQVTDKERHNQSDKLSTDIAACVAKECCDPTAKRPYTVADIEAAMKDLNFTAKPNRAAKLQVVDVVAQLKDKMSIERASFRVRIEFTMKDWKELKQNITKVCTSVEEDHFHGNTVRMMCVIEPGSFTEIQELVKHATKGTGNVTVVNVKARKSVVEEGAETSVGERSSDA